MRMKKVKLGVVGLGPRGRHLMKLFRRHPYCAMAALCDVRRENVERAAAELNDPDVRCYADFEKMVASQSLDAILIAADPDIQVSMACYAMEQGLHVATEVPAAFTMQQCRDLVHTVERTGMKYQLLEQVKYWGFIQKWK